MSDENLPVSQSSEGQFLLYQTEDGQTRIECRLQADTIWLTQRNMADLFQVTVATINEHLKNLVQEAEIVGSRTIRKFLIVQTEGNRQVSRQVDHYSLDAHGTAKRKTTFQKLGQIKLGVTKGVTII